MFEETLVAEIHAGGMHVRRLGPGVSGGVSVNIGGKEVISVGYHDMGVIVAGKSLDCSGRCEEKYVVWRLVGLPVKMLSGCKGCDNAMEIANLIMTESLKFATNVQRLVHCLFVVEAIVNSGTKIVAFTFQGCLLSSEVKRVRLVSAISLPSPDQPTPPRVHLHMSS